MKKGRKWNVAAIVVLIGALFVMPAAGIARTSADSADRVQAVSTESAPIDVAAEIARVKQEWLAKEAALEHEAIPADAKTHVKDGVAYTVIRDCAGFQAIEENLAGNYIVANDLDMTDFTTPIGWGPCKEVEGLEYKEPDPFSGIFDGNNYKIKNLINLYKVQPPENANATQFMQHAFYGVALFNNSEGIIRNLIIDESCEIDSDLIEREHNLYAKIGGGTAFIVAYNYGTVENCSNHGKISGTGKLITAAGICAQIGGGNSRKNKLVTIKNCTNFGDIQIDGSMSFSAGICGSSAMWYPSTLMLTELYNFGKISGAEASGIVAGFDEFYEKTSYKVTNSKNYGDVNVTDGTSQYRAGGIIAGDSGVAEYCMNFGTITGFDRVGGIVSNGTAVNCINYGDVTGENEVGGIIGRGGSFQNFEAKNNLQYGNVYGEDYVGGIVGNVINLDVTNNKNYADIYGTGKFVEGIVGGNKLVEGVPFEWKNRSSKQSDNLNEGTVESEGKTAYLKRVRNCRNGIIIGCTLGGAALLAGIIVMEILRRKRKDETA